MSDTLLFLPLVDKEIDKKLVASSMEFQVHKVTNPKPGYHVLCSVPPGTKIGDVHVTCGNACIIIEHGKNKRQEVRLMTTRVE